MLYDWIKEDPVKRGPMLNKWSECFKQPDFDTGLQMELKELDKLGVPLKDSTLWFNKLFLISKFTKARTSLGSFTNCFTPIFLASKYADYIYAAMHNCISDLDMLLYEFPVNEGSIDYRNKLWTVDVSYSSFTATHKQLRQSIAFRMFFSILRDLKIANVSVINESVIYSGTIYKIVVYCTKSCIRNLALASKERLNIILDELDNIPEHKLTKFNSLNAIDKAHSDMTKEAEDELIAKHGNTKYKYNDELIEIVEKHKYRLPKSPVDLVLRGQQHHNCVATYDNRHSLNSIGPIGQVTRLLLSATATAELKISVAMGLIYNVNVAQYKGRNNKDMEKPAELYNLCIALTGKPVDILRVDKIEGGSKC